MTKNNDDPYELKKAPWKRTRRKISRAKYLNSGEIIPWDAFESFKVNTIIFDTYAKKAITAGFVSNWQYRALRNDFNNGRFCYAVMAHNEPEKERPEAESIMPIYDFADSIGAKLEIVRHAKQEGQFLAYFTGAEVKRDSFLFGSMGMGKTPDEAVRDYQKIISGQTLILNAYSKGRRAFIVPDF